MPQHLQSTMRKWDDFSEVGLETDEETSKQAREGACPIEGWRRGPRGHLRKSCDVCTAAKTRCSGGIPCDRCKRRDIACLFSKRRRCGPRARAIAVDDHEDSQQLPSPSSTFDTTGPSDTTTSGGTMALEAPSRSFRDDRYKSATFNTHVTADGLPDLVDLLAPSLSDAGDGVIDSSGRNSGVTRERQMKQKLRRISGPPATTFANLRQKPPNHERASFLERETNGSTFDPEDHAVISTSPSTMYSTPPLPTEDGLPTMQAAFVDSRQLTQPRSRGEFVATQDVSAAAEATSRGRRRTESPVRSGHLQDGRQCRVRGVRIAAAEERRSAGRQPPSRGPLPLALDPQSRAHLRSFMRNFGSVVLLPGAKALQEAIYSHDEGDRWPQQPPANAPATRSGDGETRGLAESRSCNDAHFTEQRDGSDAYGPRSVKQEEAHGRWAGSAVRQGNNAATRGKNDGMFDVLTAASRAEAWAAVAVGAQCGGAGWGEANDYISRALYELTPCLDAPLPEVASVMVLLALFWIHAMEQSKAMRYFGFAQQIGMELGALMPEGLRRSIDFTSALLSTTFDSYPAPTDADGLGHARDSEMHTSRYDDDQVGHALIPTNVASGMIPDTSGARSGLEAALDSNVALAY